MHLAFEIICDIILQNITEAEAIRDGRRGMRRTEPGTRQLRARWIAGPGGRWARVAGWLRDCCWPAVCWAPASRAETAPTWQAAPKAAADVQKGLEFGKELLADGDFERGGQAVPGAGISPGWFDLSSWADLKVAYSLEGTAPHGAGSPRKSRFPISSPAACFLSTSSGSRWSRMAFTGSRCGCAARWRMGRRWRFTCARRGRRGPTTAAISCP